MWGKKKKKQQHKDWSLLSLQISGKTGIKNRTDCIMRSPTTPKYTNPQMRKKLNTQKWKNVKYKKENKMDHIYTKMCFCSRPLDPKVLLISPSLSIPTRVASKRNRKKEKKPHPKKVCIFLRLHNLLLNQSQYVQATLLYR